MYPALEVDMTSEFNNTAMLSSCLHVSEKFPRTFVWQSIAYALARCSSHTHTHTHTHTPASPASSCLTNPSCNGIYISLCVCPMH